MATRRSAEQAREPSSPSEALALDREGRRPAGLGDKLLLTTGQGRTTRSPTSVERQSLGGGSGGPELVEALGAFGGRCCP